MKPGRSDLLHVLVRMVTAPDLEGSRLALAAVESCDAGTLVRLARAHGLEAWLTARAPPTWPEGLLREIRAQRLAFVAATARQRALVGGVSAAFAVADIAWVVLKGLALGDQVYPRPDLRHGVDVDVLVRPHDFERALDALSTAGLVLVDRNWPLLRALEVGEVRLRSPSGVLLDLHWHLVNDRDLRGRFSLSAEVLVGRAVVGGDTYRRLDDIDQVIAVGLHAALSGGNRLLWLLDMDLLVRQTDLDWGTLEVRGREAGAGPALALVLDRCQALLGTPVPTGVISRLGGPVWWAWCRWVRRRSPLADDPSVPSLARAASRAARPRAVASVRALASHAVTWAADRNGDDGPAWLDPDQPGSALYDVDSPTDRAAYLRSIARSG